ncbi:MAG: nitroreductase family protein [Chloroflexi bacterium HGW-Chloroflexi-4]|nr:MAG: nitroreductase family protein [Chloroflexi bacterium HGW-Chloroflexi-4]
MNAIFNRRSIRKYTKQEISEDSIELLLKAAMAAPSAGNQQPWHFIVITDKEILYEIPKFHPYSQMLRDAACAIVVCGDLVLETNKGFWVQDCSAATENILIEATDLGLGAVWLGVYPDKDRVKPVQNLLELPETVIPLSIIAVGYPTDTKTPTDRFNAKRIHRDKW